MQIRFSAGTPAVSTFAGRSPASLPPNTAMASPAADTVAIRFGGDNPLKQAMIGPKLDKAIREHEGEKLKGKDFEKFCELLEDAPAQVVQGAILNLMDSTVKLSAKKQIGLLLHGWQQNPKSEAGLKLYQQLVGPLYVEQPDFEYLAKLANRLLDQNQSLQPGEQALLGAYLKGDQTQIDSHLFINAVRKNDLSSVLARLESGSVKSLLSWKDADGNTALHWAAHEGHTDIVDALITARANVNVRNNSGGTPLHWAAHKGHVGAVKSLIRSGANINAQNNAGSTPLHWSASEGHVEVAKALFEAGADLVIKDGFRQRPCQVTRDSELRELLKPTF